MTKKYLNKFPVILIFFSSLAYGQKTRYKDIYSLLNLKQYNEAEPFLKTYLKENDDNPNAFLFMGVVYHEKSLTQDILKQKRAALSLMDSAILFYDKANKSIDEKEIRKNKEYYTLYNRRDLRTGEFGVKLSDIQYDLGKRMESLKELKDRILMVNHYFKLTDSLYRKSAITFKRLQSLYPAESALYLQSDEKTLNDLNTLTNRYDSCLVFFENYKSSLQSIKDTRYKPVLRPREIKDIKKDGHNAVDFYAQEIEIWDYKAFAQKTKDIILKEIIPIRDYLLSYDREINKLREKMNTDSVSVKNDLTKLVEKMLLGQLRKFDPDPLPLYIFSVKMADIEYRSTVLENKVIRNKPDLSLHVKALAVELKTLNKLDSLATLAMGMDVDQKGGDYAHYIKHAYNNPSILKSYLKATKEFAMREKESTQHRLAQQLESMKWLLSEKDSIPLFASPAHKKFIPLLIIENKYTVGIKPGEKIGYLFTAPPTHIPDVKVYFPLDTILYSHSHLSQVKALSFSDNGGQMFFMLVFSSQQQHGIYPSTLAKAYRSDGLAWSFNIPLSFVPTEIIDNPENGGIIIKSKDQQVKVDKNGKVLSP